MIQMYSEAGMSFTLLSLTNILLIKTIAHVGYIMKSLSC